MDSAPPHGFLREHSWPVVFSVLLHGSIVAGVVLMTLLTQPRSTPTLQPLPIDAVVVDSQVVHTAQRLQSERAEQELARARAAAEAKAAAAAQADADAQLAEDAQAAAAKQAEADNAAAAAKAATAHAAEEQRAADAQRASDARKAAEVEAAQSEAAAKAKQAADAKQAAEAKQAADRQAAEAKQAADAKRAADDRAKQERESELRRQLADEEHVSAVQSGPLRDSYITLLRNRIQSAWIKPPSARAGVDCLVEVTQIPGGEVTAARVTQCNGDAAVRQSIENAVYRASPLPDPPDPALFERNFEFRFKPNE